MSYDKEAVRKVLDAAKREERNALTAPEGKLVCEAYGIAVPKEGVAKTAADATALARRIGFPVALKIVSPDILHKTEAGGVVIGVGSAAEAEQAFANIMANARKHDPHARLDGVQVQQMASGREVIIGAVTDSSFGKLVAFGLGGVLVEVMKDVTFRLAPTTQDQALSMLDDIAAAPVLQGVRGDKGVNREALSALIERVSKLVSEFPEISELDLNPVFASPEGGGGRRAHRARLRGAAAAEADGPRGDPGRDAPHHAARFGGRDRPRARTERSATP